MYNVFINKNQTVIIKVLVFKLCVNLKINESYIRIYIRIARTYIYITDNRRCIKRTHAIHSTNVYNVYYNRAIVL